VDRSGDDLVLTWGAVTTDIYGNATVVDHYNVYRGSVPTFLPSDTVNRIGQVSATGSPAFTHAGGALTSDNGFYLVSATDSSGFSSGLGGDLPAGVLTLQVDASPTPGMLRLSWTPVSVTVTGQPATIDHYTLYGSTQPLPRRSIGPGNLLLDGLTGSSIDVTIPPFQAYYYNLVVVDARGNLSPY
jgi:hypothetical protein